jgi:hypothetical protein
MSTSRAYPKVGDTIRADQIEAGMTVSINGERISVADTEDVPVGYVNLFNHSGYPYTAQADDPATILHINP